MTSWEIFKATCEQGRSTPVVICETSFQSLKPFMVVVREPRGGPGVTLVVLATHVAEDLPQVFYYS